MVGVYRLEELGFRLAAGCHVLSSDFVEAIAVSSSLVETARSTADEMVLNARRTIEAETNRGYAEGTARAQLEAARRLLEENSLLERKMAALEADLADLVCSCVRKLMGEFDDGSKARAVVKSALREMRHEKRAEIRVAPARCDEMREAIGSMLDEQSELVSVVVVDDDSLAQSEVVIETATGRIEGDLTRGLEELLAAIRGSVQASHFDGPPMSRGHCDVES